MWVLRFGTGVTSAGFVVGDALAREVALDEGEPAWRRLLDRLPAVREQFAGAVAVRPFSVIPRLSYRAAAASGAGWALLRGGGGFGPPLSPGGWPRAPRGGARLGRVLEEAWGTDALDARLAEYAAVTLDEADVTADYVGACLAAMRSFEVFAPLSMFYFAAASFAEVARRMGSPAAPRRFLASDDPAFLGAVRRAAAAVRDGSAFADPPRFAGDVARAVARRNVAGLCDPAKRNWYGVDLEDAVRGADLLGVDPARARAWAVANA
jgi:FADH2 O2-dependent halogenase